MKVVFSTAAYAGLLVETQEKIRTETGGVFLGCFHGDVWYIIETIDPGPKSIFRVDYFEYDQPYISHLINKRARLYKANLTLVGLWHRHPGSFDIFSTTDDGTNAKYALISPNGALSMLVNIDPVFRLSVFHVKPRSNQRPDYSLINYEVGDDKIPQEYLEKKDSMDIQNSIDHAGIRSMGLYEYMKNVILQLEPVQDIQSEESESNVTYLNRDMQQNDTEIIRNRLIDLTLDHIDYLSNQIKFKISAAWNADVMEISENVGENKRLVFRFKYLLPYDCSGLEFEDKIYFCKENMFCSDKLCIKPNGTMRARNGVFDVSRGECTLGTNTVEANEIERAYINIRNGLYKFFQVLMDDSSKKG